MSRRHWFFDGVLASIVLFSLLASFLPGSIAKAWSNDPTQNTAICTASGSQGTPRITSDGSGGAIITWQDYRSGNWDIYAQRVNSAGAAQWTADGVAISTALDGQSSPQLISDGSGGAIIAWGDNRNGNWCIYAQRVNSAGAAQWTADGVAISTASGGQGSRQLTSDGSAGAIITWYDYRSGNNDIYAQRINAAGAVEWTANGVAICTASGDQGAIQGSAQITSDGSGGAIITWHDYRSGSSYDIYAQRINSSGYVQWIADGVAIGAASGDQIRPQITSDGSAGAIITWMDQRSSSDYDIYAQRVNSAGAVQWTANGVAICTAFYAQQSPQIISDGSAGAIITWYDGRGSDHDIYAQRVNSAGAVQWTANGVAICTASRDLAWPQIISDGSAGAIITWEDTRGSDYDIYAQRVNSAGAVQWTANGVAICTASGGQSSPQIISDGSGGAIIAWTDTRSGSNSDIYAQRVHSSGSLPTPATVTLTSTATSPTKISPVPVTATFSEAVTGFVVGDITVGNGTAGNFVAVSSTVYTFDVIPSDEGAVTVNVAADVAQDAASNGNTAATQYSITYIIDRLPNQPSNVSPANGDTSVSLTPTLQSSTFSDPDAGDAHAASQWQITATSGNYSGPVFDSQADTANLLSILVPAGKLSYSTSYYWHVRYQDDHSAWSDWSASTSFTTIAAPATSCWAVIVGVSDYEYFLPLSYAAADAQAIYNKLSPIWGKDHIDLLLNSGASKAAIQNAIVNWLAPREHSGDTVLVYFSGHGEQYAGHEYISPWNSLTGSWANDIRDDEFAGWLAQLESNHLAVILDSCNSGGFINELSASGRVILTACSTDESAWEDTSLDHSVFTNYLLDALGDCTAVDTNHNYQISAEELFAYAQPKVADFRGDQHPRIYDGCTSGLSLFDFAVFDASPQVTSITVDGATYSGTALPATLYWVTGSVHQCQVQAPEAPTGTRYVFQSWSDGSTLPDRNLSQGGEYTATYLTQYTLTVQSGMGNPQGAGWYTSGTQATVSVTSPSGVIVRHVFAGWSGSASGNTPTVTTIMDGPKTLTADWRTDYTQLYILIIGVLLAAGVATAVIILRRRRQAYVPVQVKEGGITPAVDKTAEQQTAQTMRDASLTEQPQMVQPIPVAARQETSWIGRKTMDYTKREAYSVGKKQKAIMWLLLAGIAAYIALFLIPLFGLIVVIVVAVTGFVLVYQLAAAQKSSVAWLWALLNIFPLVSWICLLILNQKATKILRDKGVKVGLMGANSEDLENLLKQ